MAHDPAAVTSAMAPRALVLAGRRGPTDPVALSLGASHRALVPIAGIAMLERVLVTLLGAGVAEATVSIDDAHVLDGLPRVRELARAGRVRTRPSAASPASSVLDFLRAGGGAPVLVTTADHPLLTRAMLEAFWRGASDARADVGVGVVTESVFRARYPQLQRTFVRLADDAFSGANLFAFLSERGAAVADFWRRAERHRKQPWRLARALGLVPLLQFAAGRLTVDGALGCVERATGARAALVKLAFAEAAIDVDRPADFTLASRLLEAEPRHA
jgi:GTP:adenosylcobinamide-phosphate guanylyltransferase